jgi:hypothetical protein
MKKIESQNGNTFINVMLSILAIFAIKSIFEHDNSRIISKKGSKFLSDDLKMKAINKEIKKLESTNNHQEVII